MLVGSCIQHWSIASPKDLCNIRQIELNRTIDIRLTKAEGVNGAWWLGHGRLDVCSYTSLNLIDEFEEIHPLVTSKAPQYISLIREQARGGSRRK